MRSSGIPWSWYAVSSLPPPRQPACVALSRSCEGGGRRACKKQAFLMRQEAFLWFHSYCCCWCKFSPDVILGDVYCLPFLLLY